MPYTISVNSVRRKIVGTSRPKYEYYLSRKRTILSNILICSIHLCLNNFTNIFSSKPFYSISGQTKKTNSIYLFIVMFFSLSHSCWSSIFRQFNLIFSYGPFPAPVSVRSDLAKNSTFGKILKIFGNFLRVHLVFSKIMSLLWQIISAFGESFIAVNGQIIQK